MLTSRHTPGELNTRHTYLLKYILIIDKPEQKRDKSVVTRTLLAQGETRRQGGFDEGTSGETSSHLSACHMEALHQFCWKPP
mmetsp:Transcript_12269/g.28322  ORF Transcript_12269/g.28322 Transcript_12269/m.28322 type:complete len:82 (-) Transcript_12269:2421-2666(-)